MLQAQPASPKAPRIHRQAIEKLTRRTCQDVIDGKLVRRTLHFTFPGGRKNRRSSVSFIDPEQVPPFEGDEAWFLIELVIAKPWSYWRAVRQVEPPQA
ncbi:MULTISPECIES: hypothetical protein [Caulobacter]|jgi:hypothetical protein|uniref:hypothetical protein n=1 Tax=Caulobacter TaxID=75 RepID=UPI000780BBB4|nr:MULTISPECIES: hypothetical protein [Caulobacter]ATC24320.1 hypothetical protein CA608_07190 [Caulobacter vibrioides]MBQ1561983.1 hypothetical protein [Caulobacter sp.]MCK5908357.1 hypothetical protein [Caulobacter sp.]PIB97075.1 hypothetical protein CSW60_21665 [Caulobacter sp. X]